MTKKSHLMSKFQSLAKSLSSTRTHTFFLQMLFDKKNKNKIIIILIITVISIAPFSLLSKRVSKLV